MNSIAKYFAELFKGLSTLWAGMRITGKYFFSPGAIVTQQYPENRKTLKMTDRFKGEIIMTQPQSIVLIAIPLFIQTCLIFILGYWWAKLLKMPYADAAPAAMIGASNHFEVVIATSTMLFGLSSGASLATVVGVLIEVPVMLMLVKICLKTQHWFKK